jgi:miniconductance mechanosensitive channel
MTELITQWLLEQGVSEAYVVISSILVGLGIIFSLSAIGYYFCKHQLLVFIQNLVTKTRNTWDDTLLEHKVFSRIAFVLPFILLLLLTPIFLPLELLLTTLLLIFAKVGLCFQVARCIDATLNVVKNSYKQTAKERYLPLNSTIQVIKLVVYLVASILAISFLLNKSPIYLLSGLGALTAVLLLVFQDTIKGLVASIQISANKMVAPGDWIEIPSYGADGDVLEIGLNTVKVQNFDNTVTTVPTYALINGSFKNWRDMFNSGGRRIKRTIIIDISSVEFYNNQQIEGLAKISLLAPYLQKKQSEIKASFIDAKNEEIVKGAVEEIPEENNINNRKLTNIGTFRAYIEAYLKHHDNIHQQMTCMVRQLTATESGLPLEVYCFSNDQNWVNYEAIQADIFDHLFAMAPVFELRIFQHPTGHDWRKNT